MQVKEEAGGLKPFSGSYKQSTRGPVLTFNKEATLMWEISPGSAENTGVAQVRVELTRPPVILQLRSIKESGWNAESSHWVYLCPVSHSNAVTSFVNRAKVKLKSGWRLLQPWW